MPSQPDPPRVVVIKATNTVVAQRVRPVLRGWVLLSEIGPDLGPLQKIKVVNQPVRPADSAGPFQRFMAPASTLPGLARGRGQAEPIG